MGWQRVSLYAGYSLHRTELSRPLSPSFDFLAEPEPHAAPAAINDGLRKIVVPAHVRGHTVVVGKTEDGRDLTSGHQVFRVHPGRHSLSLRKLPVAASMQ